METETAYEIATLAGGCFWCTEALFRRLKGVHLVVSGYAGGSIANPSYTAVSTGVTNHAEAIQIQFNSAVLPYERLLEIFWHVHNPTTKNQQGADIGTQYRSIIFYHTEEQKKIAERSEQNLATSGLYKDPIVTEILPFTSFYKAEDYHQDYYEKNASAPYCSLVVDPKIKKLLEQYGEAVKPEYQS